MMNSELKKTMMLYHKSNVQSKFNLSHRILNHFFIIFYNLIIKTEMLYPKNSVSYFSITAFSIAVHVSLFLAFKLED
jgi:hypothetical protein